MKNKVENTYKYLFDVTVEKQKREDSANNMLVLAKERAGMPAQTFVAFSFELIYRFVTSDHVRKMWMWCLVGNDGCSKLISAAQCL